MVTVLAKFSLPFQRRVLQLVIQDVTFASQYASFLRTSYFESPRFARLFEAWRRLYRRLGVPPTGNVLLESCRLTAPDLQPVARKVAFADPLPVAEVRFITQELSRYVRFQALKTALRDSVEPLGRGDLDALERGLQTALQMGRRSMDGGELWYVKQVAERLSFSAQESFMAMLIPPLDAVVKVGRQDLVVGLAAPNTGKTFFLLWMMLAAYVQKKKAVFYTLEIPAITLARRLDSVVAKLNTADLPRARGLVLARVNQ